MTDEIKIMTPEDFSVECQDTKTKSFKRQRSENWSEVDKELLKELVRKRVKSIENKNTDTNTNNMKKKAWLDLQNDFNSLCSCEKRTVGQIKSQWATIKINAKKEVSEHRLKLKQTGGGQPPTDLEISGNDIAVWLPNEFAVDTNIYDSDEIFMKESTTSKNCGTITELPQYICEKEVPIEKEPEPTAEPKITPLKKKKIMPEKSNVADDSIHKIVNFDVECRRELHLLQVEAEKKRIRNYDLEFELIQARLNFYKKKSFDNFEI